MASCGRKCIHLRTLLFIVAAVASYSQPVADLTSKLCPGDATKPMLAAMLPASFTSTGASVLVPVCLSLGVGLKINMDAVFGPAIEATQVTQSTQRMVMERISDSTFGDQTSVAITLKNSPAPETLVLCFYKGTGWWSNQFDALTPTAGKTVGVVLPAGRLIRTGEYIMLVYWTTDPPPTVAALPPVSRVKP